jgi:hypothetical protein
MIFEKYFFTISFIFVLFFSCKDDEDTDTQESIISLEIQTPIDDELIVNYLKSHFYNYEDFKDVPEDDHNVEIKLDSLDGDNSSKISLWEQIETITIDLEEQDGNVVATNLYILKIREGLQEKPSIVDSTFVSYQGSLLNGIVFDGRSNPVWFDLSNVIRGFREAIPQFSGGSFSIKDDGTYSFKDYGKGVIFLPSSLGYYSSDQSLIPSYSPLIFKISLYTSNPSDHDLDGILSIDEDVDGDGSPLNDDSDTDNIPNMFDDDDDGDGVKTKDEYDLNNDGIPDDSDGDGIPNYLDEDSA